MNTKDYYKTDSKVIPVRWCSPEVLRYGKFTTKSDVWAFGVVLWEMFSYGMIPYFPMSNAEIFEKVIEGYRLSIPKECPKEIYEWMLVCWSEEVEKRPSFKKLYEDISNVYKNSIQSQHSTSNSHASNVK